MFKHLSAATVLALGLAAYTAAGQEGVTARASPKPNADGFIMLFNGHDLTGWAGLPGFWSITNGSISGRQMKETSKQTFLVFTPLKNAIKTRQPLDQSGRRASCLKYRKPGGDGSFLAGIRRPSALKK
jgi:hypothetical protein